MTDAFDDLAHARSRVRAQVEAARARNVAITTLADTVATTTATVRSARGEVTVTARSDATIVDIVVAPGALGLRHDALGRLLTDTVARAQRAAADKALESAEDALGAHSDLVTGLRADLDRRTGLL
jgi:hypothetical protein